MSNSSGLLLARLRVHFKSHTKADFCRKTGIPPQTLKNWLSGTAIPLDVVDPIAKELGYGSAWELLKPTSEKKLHLVVIQGGGGDTLRELLAILPRLKEDKLQLLLRAATGGKDFDEADKGIKRD